MIVHLDMDAFFASVEQLDDPALRGRPVIVGGLGPRGVVSTASYEARRFGVRSAMPMTTARRLCPRGVFLPGRRARYVELSRRIMDALRGFSPLVEPASIDEAYLDAAGTERDFGTPEALLDAIAARIREVTGGLTCSAGAAPVKFLAKICSDMRKPDGRFVLHPEDVEDFLLPLPVDILPGVGGRTAERLRGMGVLRVAQLRALSLDTLASAFGKWGLEMRERAFGRDPRPVEAVHVARSESAESTFAHDTLDRSVLEKALLAHAERVGASLRRHGLRGRTVTLKIAFSDFRRITRSRTLDGPVCSTGSICDVARDLLRAEPLPLPVRLVGLGVSGFQEPAAARLALPGMLRGVGCGGGREKEERSLKVDAVLDAVREKFGRNSIRRAGGELPDDGE